MSELTTQVVGVLVVLGIAGLVRIVTAMTHNVLYPTLLVVVGIGISVVGFQPGIELSAELIRTVLVPTILFSGAEQTKSEHFWPILPLATVLTAIGVPVAVVLLGALGSQVLGLPLAIALLFAAIIYPIDPVAIIAVFRETAAEERLAVLAEMESHLSDGVAIVLFSVFLTFVSERGTTAAGVVGIVGPDDLLSVGGEVLVVSLGGVAVGLIASAVVYGVIRPVTDRMAELLFVVVLPYASYLLAEHTLQVSGVLAVVTAGLFVGTYGKGGAIDDENVEFVERFWTTGSFLVYTLVFVMIGVDVPFRRVLARWETVLVAWVLLLVVRAVVVYTLLNAITVATERSPVPRRFQHVLVWGGMHTVIPIALLLIVPPEFPFRSVLGPLVFGVAVLSIVVQGLVLPVAIRLVGATEEAVDEAEEAVEETVDDAS